MKQLIALILLCLTLFISCDNSKIENSSQSAIEDNLSCKLTEYKGKGEKEEYTDPKNGFKEMSGYMLDNLNTYNMIDYLDNPTKMKESKNVEWITGKDVNSVMDKRLILSSSQVGGYIIYELEEIASIRVEVFAKSESNDNIKVMLSEDNVNYTEHKTRATEIKTMDSYKSYAIISDVMPLSNMKYLKIAINQAEVYINRIMANCYNSVQKGNEQNRVVEKSGNVDKCDHGYCITNDKKAEIVVYKNYMNAFKFTIEYNGVSPEIALYTSENGSDFIKTDFVSTQSVINEAGFRSSQIISKNGFNKPQNFIKIELEKSNNKRGEDLHITKMFESVVGFYDYLETSFNMQEFSSNMSFNTSVEKPYVYSNDGSDFSFVYNKNNIKGLNINAYYLEKSNINLAVSQNGKDYQNVKYNEYIEGEDSYGTKIRFSNSEEIPSNMNYLRISVKGSDKIVGYRLSSVNIDADNDPVEELKKVAQLNGRKFSDIFSITHAAGGYFHTKDSYLIEGVKAVEQMGGKVINLFAACDSVKPPKYTENYPFNYVWDTANIKTSKDLLSQPPFKEAFASNQIQTFILYLGTPTQPNFKQKFTDEDYEEVLSAEYIEFKNVCEYLLTEYKGSNKRFILQTWESDWWCMDQPTLTYYDDALLRLQKWINIRQKAVEDARAEVKPEGVEVYNCLEFINGSLAMEGKTTVINNVVPNTKCDLYAYSAYDTTIPETNFDSAIKYIKSKLPSSKLLGENNFYIGEFGMPEMEFGDQRMFSNALKCYKTMLNNNVLYGNYWQLYCNEPKDSKPKNNSHDNNYYRGFWTIRADGTKNQTYYLLQMALSEE